MSKTCTDHDREENNCCGCNRALLQFLSMSFDECKDFTCIEAVKVDSNTLSVRTIAGSFSLFLRPVKIFRRLPQQSLHDGWCSLWSHEGSQC